MKVPQRKQRREEAADENCPGSSQTLSKKVRKSCNLDITGSLHSHKGESKASASLATMIKANFIIVAKDLMDLPYLMETDVPGL